MDLIIETAKGSKDIWGRIQYTDHDLLTTVGKSIEEVENNMRDQFSAFYDLDSSKFKFTIKYDLTEFFEQYSELNMSAVAKKARISGALMQQFESGIKFPSAAQVKKIEKAVQSIGRELAEVSLTTFQD